MLSKDKIQMYYEHHLNSIFKIYIKNFGEVSWKTPQELELYESSKRLPWEQKICDKFVYNSSQDKTLLGKDILNRGTYWAFFTIYNQVFLGYHRMYSLKQLNINQKFLCVELDHNHIGKNNLCNNNKELGYRLHVEIPSYFEPPGDSNVGEIKIWKNKPHIDVNEDFIMVEATTYKDILDLLRITPHWIRNYFYDYKIQPSPIINNREIFEKWIKN